MHAYKISSKKCAIQEFLKYSEAKATIVEFPPLKTGFSLVQQYHKSSKMVGGCNGKEHKR